MSIPRRNLGDSHIIRGGIVMKDMAQTERQIFILLLLSENKRGYTINDIHDSLEKWDVIVDKKTIMRDIDSLSGICFISEEDRSGRTYYTADNIQYKRVINDG